MGMKTLEQPMHFAHRQLFSLTCFGSSFDENALTMRAKAFGCGLLLARRL